MRKRKLRIGTKLFWEEMDVRQQFIFLQNEWRHSCIEWTAVLACFWQCNHSPPALHTHTVDKWRSDVALCDFFFCLTSVRSLNARSVLPCWMEGCSEEVAREKKSLLSGAQLPAVKDFSLLGWISFSPPWYLVFSGQWSRHMLLASIHASGVKMNILA